MTEGHGDHWGCLFSDVETSLAYWLPTAVEHARLLDPRPRDRNGRTIPLQPGELAGLSYPEAPLSGLVLVAAVDSGDDRPRSEMVSAYPFIRLGARHRLTVTDISPWPDGYEAWVRGRWGEDGPHLAFFDTRFYATGARYRIGGVHEFILGAMAYQAEVVEPKPAFITDPETIRAMRSASDPSVASLPDAALEPIEIRLDGAAVLFPRPDLSPDDFEFQGPVKAIATYEFDGVPMLALTVTVARRNDRDLDIVLHARRSTLSQGDRLRIGSDIRGILWLQGHIADAPEALTS